jgi:hypothetical protein
VSIEVILFLTDGSSMLFEKEGQWDGMVDLVEAEWR